MIWLSITALAMAFLAALAVGVIWSLGQILRILSPVLWPLAVAGVLSYLLDPVVDVFAKRGIPRARAIVLVFVLALVSITAVFGSVVPQMYRESRQLAERVPGYAARLQTQINTWATNPPVLVQKFLQVRAQLKRPAEPPDVSVSPETETNGVAISPPKSGPPAFDPETIRSASSWLANNIPDLGSWILSKLGRATSWAGFLAGFFLVPVYAFYFLLEKRGIESQWADYIPLRSSWFKEEVAFVLQSINDYLIVFFRSQVLVAICDGILYTTGFLIIGLPYAFLIGVISIGLTMIPFAGAITTCVCASLMALVASGSWQLPAMVLVVFAVVQAIEGLVLSPKIMGDRVGLHPLAIIVAVMVGTTVLGGLLGGLLAIPLAAALRVIMFRYIWRPSVRLLQYYIIIIKLSGLRRRLGARTLRSAWRGRWRREAAAGRRVGPAA
jgi:predicted PurR-regulated permease PerM